MNDLALSGNASAILVALGAGLLIGVERERRADGQRPAAAALVLLAASYWIAWVVEAVGAPESGAGTAARFMTSYPPCANWSSH